MVVRSVCLERNVQVCKVLCECLCVLYDLMSVILICLRVRFLESQCFCSHDVRERTAQDHRAALVHVVSEFFLAENHCAAWTAQSLVRRRRYDVSPFHRVFVACEDFSCDEACEVRHIDHQYCSALVGDFPESLEVDCARICRISCEEDERLHFHRLLFDCVVVEESSFLVNAVRMRFEHSCRDVHLVSVCEVSAA